MTVRPLPCRQIRPPAPPRHHTWRKAETATQHDSLGTPTSSKPARVTARAIARTPPPCARYPLDSVTRPSLGVLSQPSSHAPTTDSARRQSRPDECVSGPRFIHVAQNSSEDRTFNPSLPVQGGLRAFDRQPPLAVATTYACPYCTLRVLDCINRAVSVVIQCPLNSACNDTPAKRRATVLCCINRHQVFGISVSIPSWGRCSSRELSPGRRSGTSPSLVDATSRYAECSPSIPSRPACPGPASGSLRSRVGWSAPSSAPRPRVHRAQS